ncbi:glycosyltransferase family 4 protein [Cyanobium sp. ATX 6F1]|uniref:glycosyltransferase family 4 protein n=1 Tax=Cyanobium sp. ATX 6F1 TaxID=2823702 RepID=UPI0020CFDF90|nr:glycosyltransferase family 4 protein [Cyanobium sp. ATX 6F1]
MLTEGLGPLAVPVFGVGGGRFRHHGHKIGRRSDRRCHDRPSWARAIALTVNLWGHLSGGFGLGEGARCTARALAAAGVHVQWRDLPLATHINDQPLPESGDWEPAAIDLVHTNPNVLRQTDGLLERLELRAPLRIGYWAWELEAFPSGWEAGFAGLDQLWCPSTFTAQALALRSPVPVSALPHLIDWRRADRLAQRRLTVPPRRPGAPFTVLFAFDFWSTVGRKNPVGAIEAFLRAFPPGRGTEAGGSATLPPARLVLKLSSGLQFPDAAEALRERARSDPRIHVLDRHLPLEQLDALYTEADVLLSLHRAEGFGLTLAEAMAGGLPVVATGYSGNLDFMPPGSAELVPHRLVPIRRTEGDYREGWPWAEPDLDGAAAALRRLALDGAYHRRLAQAGRSAVRQRLAPDTLAAVVRQRLGCLLRQPGRAELARGLAADHPLRALE